MRPGIAAPILPLTLGILLSPLAANAQQPATVARIGTREDCSLLRAGLGGGS